ncbi:MAG: ABC transporter permease [Actinomycetota bacterium]
MTTFTAPQRTIAPPTRSSVYAAFTSRSILRFVRRPFTIVSTLAFPILLLLTMLAVFSSAIEAFEEGPYAQRLVPGLTVSAIMFGSIGTAIGMFEDLRGGYMDRVRSLPVAPSGPLVGTVAAEVVRTVVAVAVLVVLGYVFGFRFENGVGPAVGYVLVAVLCAVSVAWIGMAMATSVATQEGLGPPLNALFLVLLFLSQGLVPLAAYPGWAQPIVRVNPATTYVESLDHLARGGELVRPIAYALLWSAALVLVFGTISIRRLARGSAR